MNRRCIVFSQSSSNTRECEVFSLDLDKLAVETTSFMTEIEEIQGELRRFNEERDWDQFHSPVNLAKSIAIEAAELLECYQWNDQADPQAVEEELADVLNYCLQMAAKLELDPAEIVRKKMLSGKDEWIASVSFTGIEPAEASGFIDKLLQLGYGAHVGTSDLTLDRTIGKKRFNVLMFFGLNAVSIGFQPKSLLALSKAVTGSIESALTLLENLRPFLGSYQKNTTPYEPLNGYYYIPWSIVKEKGEALIEVMKKFISSL